MTITGDILLISLFAIILPSLLILFGTAIYSITIINRYKKIVSRLYRASFKGIDSERKRIASELHNQLAVHFININTDFDEIRKTIDKKQEDQFKKLELNLDLLKDDLHTTIENLYPKELIAFDWEKSLLKLSQQMTNSVTSVSFESFANNYPPQEKLPHVFWVVQEIITNAIKHAKAKRVIVSIMDENKNFIISIHYKSIISSTSWIHGTPNKRDDGMGLCIIKDRLKIVGATEKIDIQNSIVTHTISIRNENTAN